MARHLSKSDFVAARSCPAKLHYRKQHYPNTLDENAFMKLLADGGFMVQKMAQLLFPDGIEVYAANTEEAIARTAELLQRDRVTLFEATLVHNNLLARVDILVKDGNEIQLIEVKAKSISGAAVEERDNGGKDPFRKKSDWAEHLDDIAFQTHVFRSAFPTWTVAPYLMLCDTDKYTAIDQLNSQFVLHDTELPSGHRSMHVEFTGDVEALLADHILCQINVEDEVAHLADEIAKDAQCYADSLCSGAKLAGTLSPACKKCEYRLPNDHIGPNGFQECWGSLADVRPHLLELTELGRIKSGGNNIAEGLFHSRQASLYDIEPFIKGDGPMAIKQRRQLECTRDNIEYCSPELAEQIERLRYPLHFIDFEGARMAVPWHRDMRSYEQVCFQWSCHTQYEPDGPLTHKEWLNTSREFPSFEFARSLKDHVGDSGHLLVWSHYENSALRDVLKQLGRHETRDPELADWLEHITYDPNNKRDSKPEQCPQRDLLTWARDHYYHPAMCGSWSIKAVLPAIWREGTFLHTDPDFAGYVQYDDLGHAIDPYKTLTPMQAGEHTFHVTEGTGAITAYQLLLYHPACQDPASQQALAQQLRDYCKLDTLAMVMILRYWMERVGA